MTSPIVLTEITPSGSSVARFKVPTDELVTSFSSKSELALDDSTTDRALTFMDYVARDRQLDVSNSNTPGVVDPTNPVPGSDYRAVAKLSGDGRLSFAQTNAYSGNNGRAAILDDRHGAGTVYTAGNAGNGANPQPNGVILGAGAQIIGSPFSLPPTRSRSACGSPARPRSTSPTRATVTPGEQGADPNALVAITDDPATAAPAGDEAFHTVVAPRYARVVRGVALTPDSEEGGGWRGLAVGHAITRRLAASGRA